MVTDGDIGQEKYLNMNGTTPATRGSVTIDLGQNYYVDYIRVRHYWVDGRRYNEPILSVGTSLPENDDGNTPLETIVWDDISYVERSCGIISPWLQGDLGSE